MAATLIEPTVLAAAKETLYPDLDTDGGTYAVTETQFRRLAPYNTIRLTNWEPDLLGVGMPVLDEVYE